MTLSRPKAGITELLQLAGYGVAILAVVLEATAKRQTDPVKVQRRPGHDANGD